MKCIKSSRQNLEKAQVSSNKNSTIVGGTWVALFLVVSVLFPPASAKFAAAQDSCPFVYEEHLVHESTSGKTQALDPNGRTISVSGNWVDIYSRSKNDRVRKFGQAIGRVDLCWENDEDDRRFIQYCTGALLAKNRVLTNHHCIYPAGTSPLKDWYLVEARLVMGFDDIQDTRNVISYALTLNPERSSKASDAVLLRVRGNPNAEWGQVRLQIAEISETEEALMMIQHPGGITKQFNPVRCHVHSSQVKADDTELRHVCDTAGGSSGSLVLRERDLAILALHHRGGLAANDHRSFNRAVKIGFVAKELGLQTRKPVPIKPINIEEEATEALRQAGLDPQKLHQVVAKFPGTDAAQKARQLLLTLDDQTEKLAHAALIDAGLGKAKLQAVVLVYPETKSAQRARQLLDKLKNSDDTNKQEEKVKAFVANQFNRQSLRNLKRSIYASRVRYYGKSRSLNSVMKAKKAYFSKWPSFWAGNETNWSIEFQPDLISVRWTHKYKNSPTKEGGWARNHLKLRTVGDKYKIVFEDGKVIPK